MRGFVQERGAGVARLAAMGCWVWACPVSVCCCVLRRPCRGVCAQHSWERGRVASPLLGEEGCVCTILILLVERVCVGSEVTQNPFRPLRLWCTSCATHTSAIKCHRIPQFVVSYPSELARMRSPSTAPLPLQYGDWGEASTVARGGRPMMIAERASAPPLHNTFFLRVRRCHLHCRRRRRLHHRHRCHPGCRAQGRALTSRLGRTHHQCHPTHSRHSVPMGAFVVVYDRAASDRRSLSDEQSRATATHPSPHPAPFLPRRAHCR